MAQPEIRHIPKMNCKGFMMASLSVRQLNYRYYENGPLVLKNVQFSVEKGEIAAITGLNGSGKSTLCLCLCGAIRHQRNGCMSGEVLLNGKPIDLIKGPKLALEVGIVFQDADMQLFSSTVEDEIAFAPENLCLPPDSIRQRVDEVMNILGISHLKDENPSNLSGGEKHLVALASVLSMDPPLLILDEVMSQLDGEGKKRVVRALQDLRTGGKTIIMVDHDMDTLAIADRLLVLKDGKVICYDRTDSILANPEYFCQRNDKVWKTDRL